LHLCCLLRSSFSSSAPVDVSPRHDSDAAVIRPPNTRIGKNAVCALAAERPSAALILMSTFTGARSFAKRYLAPSFLVRDPFDNLSVVKNYPAAVLIMHGRKDTVIPYSHGIALHSAARHGKLITYEAGHNDCPPDWRMFWQHVRTFLRENKII
jgi:fermentation-respiration switch protein FrsA (DUF1100 family)